MKFWFCGSQWCKPSQWESVGPSLAASLEPLAYRRNVASFSLFYRYYLVDAHLNWVNWFHYLVLEVDLHVILRLDIFSVIIPKCYEDVYVNSLFPCPARLWNFLPIECFPLTYDLNGFKSRIN